MGSYLNDAWNALRRWIAVGEPPCEALVPFGEIEPCLTARGSVDRTVQDVPLRAIVGSVGRAHEFDRCFARVAGPSARSRRVREMTRQGRSLPPVELFRVGPGYFVVDGHNRIAVARTRDHDSVTSVVAALDVRPSCWGLEDVYGV